MKADLVERLPEPLQVGPFRPAARYPAWLRFSNGSFDAPRKDRLDLRRVALKLRPCVEVLRPLGVQNRTRKPAYWASARNRPRVAEPEEAPAL